MAYNWGRASTKVGMRSFYLGSSWLLGGDLWELLRHLQCMAVRWV